MASKIRVHLEEVFPFGGTFVLVTDDGRFITEKGAAYEKGDKDDAASFSGGNLEAQARKFAAKHKLKFSKAVLVFAHEKGDRRGGREGAILS